MIREKLFTAAIAATLVLGPASAFAWSSSSSASTETPGHQMQDNGSKPGHPAASGYAPGHQSQQFTERSTNTPGTTLDRDDATSDRSVTTRSDTGNGTTTSHTEESHATTR